MELPDSARARKDGTGGHSWLARKSSVSVARVTPAGRGEGVGRASGRGSDARSGGGGGCSSGGSGVGGGRRYLVAVPAPLPAPVPMLLRAPAPKDELLCPITIKTNIHVDKFTASRLGY